METIFWTALAYTVMVSDDHKRIAVYAPLATVTLPMPSTFREKFCVEVANVNQDKAIFVVGLAKQPVLLWPQTSVPVSVKDGAWSTKEGC